MYCEENVWHLCADPALSGLPAAALVITNPTRSVAIVHQRAAPAPGVAVVWDYHVVVAVRDAAHWQIWDLDSTLGLRVPLLRWLDACFGGADGFGAPYRPHFGVVAAARYRQVLRSDRSHMRNDSGEYCAAPPAWPPIGAEGTNLMDFVRLDPAFVDPVASREALAAALDRCTDMARG